MSTQMRPPRTRSTGGRTLMLLGVLLALAAGTIVIYVVSAAVGPTTHTQTVVVATKQLAAGTILSATASDATHTLITDAFGTKPVNTDFVPDGAYVYTDQSHLTIALNDMVLVGNFYPGDILRQNDARLAPEGTAATGSLTLKNPGQLPKGSVLYPLKVDGLQGLGIVPGDHVDLIVTYCVVETVGASNCPALNNESQTTMQNLYVYTITSGIMYVVVTHQDANVLEYLSGTRITVVLRAPGDTDTAATNPITGSYIFQHFHFTAQP
jgi:Flp pilus assembly protein CpaB